MRLPIKRIITDIEWKIGYCLHGSLIFIKKYISHECEIFYTNLSKAFLRGSLTIFSNISIGSYSNETAASANR